MPQEPLRVMSYNIFDGGKGRLDSITQVIKEINPDICGILEAVDWQNNLETYKNWAKEFGYNFFSLALANSKYNIAVISKFPIQTEDIKEGFRHTALKVKMKNGAFDGNIFFIHLSPKLEDDRLAELETLLPHLTQSGKNIVMGDFNSLSPHDQYNKENLLRELQEKNIIKFGTDNLRFDVINKIESSGFIDAWTQLNRPFDSSTPTPSNRDPYHASDIRIDYAFLSKDISDKLTAAKIFKNQTADIASDHYPLFIEITP